jgi:hypothetical protein
LAATHLPLCPNPVWITEHCGVLPYTVDQRRATPSTSPQLQGASDLPKAHPPNHEGSRLKSRPRPLNPGRSLPQEHFLATSSALAEGLLCVMSGGTARAS